MQDTQKELGRPCTRYLEMSAYPILYTSNLRSREVMHSVMQQGKGKVSKQTLKPQAIP